MDGLIFKIPNVYGFSMYMKIITVYIRFISMCMKNP